MAKLSETERVKADQRRINGATKLYEEWEERYSCDMLEDYYYGRQHHDESKDWDQRKYVINLFYPAINLSKPSMLFNVPKYKITPRPARIDDPLSDAEARAKLQEDTLNTIVQDPKLGYAIEAQLAALDGQFRFMAIQVGYTADFVENPLADKPMLSDETDDAGNRIPMLTSDGNPVLEPRVKIQAESMFMKWIPAKQFRVSERNTNRADTCDWIGYYEWHYPEDIRANPKYKNKDKLRPTGRIRDERPKSEGEEDHPSGMVKVWFIWDLRKKEKRVFHEGAEKYLLEEPWKFLPIAAGYFDPQLGKFYPLPPAFNWVHPQDQLNDIRNMRKVHRKRAVRRYLRKTGAITPEEWQKLCEDEDMTSAEVAGDLATAVIPMPDAPLDTAIFRDEQNALQDFTRESGASGESQQVAQSETATQANLIALMGQTRENAKRVTFAMFLSEVGRIILLTMRQMALPIWIKKSVDPYSPLAAVEAQEIAKLWQQIVGEDLGEIDNEITVEMSSMSPVAQAQERTDWMGFLAIVTNPSIGAVLASSPALLRKTAGLFGIHSERELVEVSRAMGLTAQLAQLQQLTGGKGGGLGPGPTPTNNDIAGQLQNQLPTEVLQ